MINKWIVLFATLLITISFALTIKTTIANPSLSNVLISGLLAIFIFVGLWVFNKAGNGVKLKDDEYEAVLD